MLLQMALFHSFSWSSNIPLCMCTSSCSSVNGLLTETKTLSQVLIKPFKREDSTHGHHQMVNTEIRLIIFFAAKDGEALYSQQK